MNNIITAFEAEFEPFSYVKPFGFQSEVRCRMDMGPSENVACSIGTDIPMDSDGHSDGNQGFPKVWTFQVDW